MKGAKVKGILLSLMGILLVSGMMGVAYASSDTVNNQNNFSDNKVDLKLRDQDEDWGDGVTRTWTATNMAPGEEFAFGGCFVDLWSKSEGKVKITCNYEVDEEFPQTEADTDPKTNEDPDKMAKYMVITSFVYNNEEWQIQDFDPPGPEGADGKITFYDLKKSPLKNLPSPLKDGTRFEMSVKFHEDAGNEFQGDTFNLTMIFTLKSVPVKGKS